MKIALLSIVTLLIGSASVAQASAESPNDKAPVMACMYTVSFLTPDGSEMSDLIDIDIPLKKDPTGVFKGGKTVDVGHGISLTFSGTFAKESPVKKQKWLIQRSSLIRTDVNGTKTVLVSDTNDSEASPLDHKIPSTSLKLSNPEVESAQMNNGNISAREVMKRGLLPNPTIWYSFTSCLLNPK